MLAQLGSLAHAPPGLEMPPHMVLRKRRDYEVRRCGAAADFSASRLCKLGSLSHMLPNLTSLPSQMVLCRSVKCAGCKLVLLNRHTSNAATTAQ